MAQINEQKALEAGIAEIRSALERLTGERERLDAEIAEKKAVLTFWEARLRQVAGVEPDQRKRLRKGEPERLVREAFEDGLSTSEIAERANIGWSTTRGVLQRGDYEERNGAWYRRTVAATTTNLAEVKTTSTPH